MKLALPLALLACAISTCHAQASGNGFVPFVGGGLTYGGDQIGNTVSYQDGSHRRLHAGALLDFRGGLEYQAMGSPWSFQWSLGYQVDMASANNGNINFTRFPLELLTHWQVNDNFRFGAGVRKALSPKLHTSGAGDNYAQDQSYSSSVGLVVEGEYFFTQRIGMKVRVVSEKYKPSVSGSDVDGTAVGVLGAYYFK